MLRIRQLVGILALGAVVACELATELDYEKVPCPVGRELCDGQCWDLQSAPQHCGACGNACAYSQYQECVAGVCGCAQGTTLCGQTCVYTVQDPANCGACGNQCGQTQYCSGGVCTEGCFGA